MGFIDDLRKTGKIIIGGKPSVPPGAAPPKETSVIKAIFSRRKAPGKNKLAETKTEKPKDNSVFSFAQGKSYATETEKERWLRANKNEIYKITKRRVGESELKEFGKQIFPESVVKKQDWGQHGRKEILKRLEKQIDRARNISGKYDAKENAEIAKKALGLDGKNKKPY